MSAPKLNLVVKKRKEPEEEKKDEPVGHKQKKRISFDAVLILFD